MKTIESRKFCSFIIPLITSNDQSYLLYLKLNSNWWMVDLSPIVLGTAMSITMPGVKRYKIEKLTYNNWKKSGFGYATSRLSLRI